MFNLYQLVTGAHGGQGLDSLAQQFGLSREQTDSAVQALMPALSTAFMAKASQPGGLGDIAGAMTDPQHQQAHDDPAAAQDPGVQQKGSDVAGSIFGNNAILGQVTRTAAQYTGLPESTIQAMLPVITSLVVGGAAKAMHQQGMGGMLGQLASGGLGGMLGQFGSGAGGTGGAGLGTSGMGGMGGGLPGMLGNIFSSFFGGSGGSQAAQNPAGAKADPASGLPPMAQAGMDQLFKMFQPGVSGQPGQSGGQMGGLADMISSALGGRR